MTVKKNYYTISQLAKEWNFFIVDIKNLIRSGDLRASKINDDGVLETYNKFTEIPDNLREYLKVIRSGRGIDNKYKKSARAWDQLIITAEEVSRFASINIEIDTSIEDQGAFDEIHPRTKKTLLTIIAALLNVIIGPYGTKEVEKHQSIKNISDLITKLSEMGDPGLSKSNLEYYFSKAKKTLNSSE